MAWIEETLESFRSLQIRQLLTQAIFLGIIFSSALIVWKGLVYITGSESPVVVVLSGSMEPCFQRGDILFLRMSNDPIRAGDIVVYNVKERDIPIVHRVIEVHQQQATEELNILTKGDNNAEDDREGQLYAPGQHWLQQKHIVGQAVGFLPYVGYFTIWMTDVPILKYALIGVLAFLVIASKE